MMNKQNKSYFTAGLLFGLVISLLIFTITVRNGQGPQKSQTVVLKLAHALDQSHPVHLGMVEMGEKLKELSGGRIELQIFPNGQLGSETECIEQLQRGALAMTKVSAAIMESFLPEMSVFSLPYIFRDEAHFWNVLEGPIGQKVLEMPASVGLRGLCYYDSGSRNFYTINKPILSPSDLIGQKIRVMKNKTSMDMIETMGGSPTPIPWGELYTALQQHMVDGAENNVPSFYTNRHFEVCKYFAFDEHSRIPDMLFISEKVWNELTPEERGWVQEAAKASSDYQRKLWADMTADALVKIQEEGVGVYYPEKQSFVDKVQPLLDSFKGASIGDLVEQIRETN